jgi:hypothetical protein
MSDAALTAWRLFQPNWNTLVKMTTNQNPFTHVPHFEFKMALNFFREAGSCKGQYHWES